MHTQTPTKMTMTMAAAVVLSLIFRRQATALPAAKQWGTKVLAPRRLLLRKTLPLMLKTLRSVVEGGWVAAHMEGLEFASRVEGRLLQA